ncbi:hypothetical protein AAGT95_12950 [Salinicola lusitanus]|uniref:Uncharacterized protein n=1 Tax=Salinicola lusitanus TaxID=1949085 RepID=A0ABZ3CNK1_9GAMM
MSRNAGPIDLLSRSNFVVLEAWSRVVSWNASPVDLLYRSGLVVVEAWSRVVSRNAGPLERQPDGTPPGRSPFPLPFYRFRSASIPLSPHRLMCRDAGRLLPSSSAWRYRAGRVFPLCIACHDPALADAGWLPDYADTVASVTPTIVVHVMAMEFVRLLKIDFPSIGPHMWRHFFFHVIDRNP